MNILVLAPTDRERDYIKAAIKSRTDCTNSYTVAFSGIGKAASAATITKTVLESEQKFDKIAAIGFAAGSLGFKQGEIVMPRGCQYHDCDVPDGFIPELTEPFTLEGEDDVMVYTGDSFVNAVSAKEIRERMGCQKCIYDMEITSIKIAADIMGGIPVVAIKMISDVPEDGHTEHSYDHFADTHQDFSEILNRLERL